MENTPETLRSRTLLSNCTICAARDLWIRSEEWVHARLSLYLYLFLTIRN